MVRSACTGSKRIEEINAICRRDLLLLTIQAYSLHEIPAENFLLRCGEIGCSYKYTPVEIERLCSERGTRITPLRPLLPDLRDCSSYNNAYIDKLPESPFKNLLRANTGCAIMTSQARRFMPNSFRNTYTVELINSPLTVKGKVKKMYPFVITASPTPDIPGREDCYDEETFRYYYNLVNALYSIFPEKPKIRLISLVTEVPGTKTNLPGSSGDNAVKRLKNRGIDIKRYNYLVTIIRGPSMNRALNNVMEKIKMKDGRLIILHCESGVDRAGTLLEHILFNAFKAVDKRIVGAMANSALNAMLFNLQFGIKPKAVGIPELKDMLKIRCQGLLSGANKEFMTLPGNLRSKIPFMWGPYTDIHAAPARMLQAVSRRAIARKYNDLCDFISESEF